jgi:hypothetical protein
MKKIMILICSVILFLGCPNKIDPTPGDKCKPKWYKAEASNNSVVYGYSTSSSSDSDMGTMLGLTSAQANALQQINTHIKTEAGKQVEEKLRDKYEDDTVKDVSKALYFKLKNEIDGPCNHCVLVESVECEDNGSLVIFTKVKVNVEDYLNQELRNQMDSLLEKPEELMNDIKEY